MKTTQFHKCQAYITNVNSRFDVVTSYTTDVIIVDNVTHECILGECARGFSPTTSKQVTRILYELYKGYEVIPYNSYRYNEFMQEWNIPDYWGRFNKCCCFWVGLKNAN